MEASSPQQPGAARGWGSQAARPQSPCFALAHFQRCAGRLRSQRSPLMPGCAGQWLDLTRSSGSAVPVQCRHSRAQRLPPQVL